MLRLQKESNQCQHVASCPLQVDWPFAILKLDSGSTGYYHISYDSVVGKM